MNRDFLLMCAFIIVLIGCSGNRSSDIGIINGKLSMCPKSPNCVSSQNKDKNHYMDPIYYDCSLEEAREKLISVIKNMKRVKIVALTEDYIHAEFVSMILRFIDDVEFLFDDQNKTIHFRSASRVGYYDLGVNRKRMKKIKAGFGSRT